MLGFVVLDIGVDGMSPMRPFDVFHDLAAYLGVTDLCPDAFEETTGGSVPAHSHLPVIPP
ncbi:hypothetical protein GCM10022402_06330 [Salinactinospora qingdaonensis]|uniref:Uncharacterized protein n=1 Tax=Salinactinospora qingdaonensis TaxID=702744 RepID=A0ABP7EZG3_9ACTN